MKEIIADLHLHSRFSRASSKDITIENLVKWARIKGLDLLGTGDFTHPVWLAELKKKLKEKNGILWYEDEKGKFPFILSSEISLAYHQGKGRKVHLLYLAPGFEIVDKINSWLDSIGRRDYDGRPIFGISCRDFVAKMEEISKKIEVIPAHAWTPYFGIFGSKSGFDGLKEAFLDKTDRIHAIETGISSDPAMNWKIKDLENISIVSFSDSHSFWPWRLGREATIFKLEKSEIEDLTYETILRQIRENDFIATIETDPSYGKYHWDGHAKCNFSCPPSQTKVLGGICPKCGSPLTVGVEYRVEELSQKAKAEHKGKKPYYKLLPLHELIAITVGGEMNSKTSWKIYNKLIKNFKNEFEILLRVEKTRLAKVIEEELKNDLLVELILKNREGKIKIKPGFDGKYGEIILPKREDQKKLF